MTLEHVGTVMVDLDSKVQWLWYADGIDAAITGDERDAFALSGDGPITAARLERGDTGGAWNLPLPVALADQFLDQPWNGLRFLDRAAYARVDADVLRTLVFGPDYGLPMRHPASGAIVGLRSRSIELFKRGGDDLQSIGQTKTRGKAALCFAAHPNEPLLVYGDNFGTFTAHRFAPDGFGKPTKLAEKERKASRAAFLSDGATLLIGGMGYLAALSYDGKAFAPKHEVSIAVRDFALCADNTVVVNHGLNGVTAYRYDEQGFAKLAEVKPKEAVQSLVVSCDGKRLVLTHQDSPKVSVYRMG